MKILNTIAIAVIGFVLLFLVFFNMFMKHLDVGEVGVRTKQYAVFGQKGVEEKDFTQGWHRNLPMIDTWNVFDATVQSTEFTTHEEREATRLRNSFFDYMSKSSSSGYNRGPDRIELKTKDGFSVKLDVTVKYRVMPGKVYELYKRFNTEERYKGIVRDRVQDTLRNVFGTIKTEEFYNPNIRRVKTEQAYTDLKEDLGKSYIELVSILVRDISFDKSYERKILDKKLADQDEELYKSKTLAEEKKGLTNKIAAETEAMVKIIEQEKQAEQINMKADTDKLIAQLRADAILSVAKIKADADLYAAELEAKGQLLEKEAEAKGQLLKATAMNGSGGDNMVALEAVQNLKLLEATISTQDKDFLDLDAMVKSLGASQ
jgi:regulator of protease activity HflC (stomatin/prohibitin superfamily)